MLSHVGVFGVYRERVAAGLDAGLTIEQLDEQVLRDAPLDEDEKAALWLFGHALLDLRGHSVRAPVDPSSN
jgi:hypothetical protein